MSLRDRYNKNHSGAVRDGRGARVSRYDNQWPGSPNPYNPHHDPGDPEAVAAAEAVVQEGGDTTAAIKAAQAVLDKKTAAPAPRAPALIPPAPRAPALRAPEPQSAQPAVNMSMMQQIAALHEDGEQIIGDLRQSLSAARDMLQTVDIACKSMSALSHKTEANMARLSEIHDRLSAKELSNVDLLVSVGTQHLTNNIYYLGTVADMIERLEELGFEHGLDARDKKAAVKATYKKLALAGDGD